MLRQDLRLLPGGKDEAGENEWLLYDPLRHQYFALSRTALLLLRHLPKIGSLDELKAMLSKNDAQIEDYEIEQFLSFIRDNFLSVGSDLAHVQKISAEQEARRTNWFMWLVHNYLFIKIPLIRPDRFLDGLLAITRPFAKQSSALSNIWLGRLRHFFTVLAMGKLHHNI